MEWEGEMEPKTSPRRTALPGLLIGLAGAVALLAGACTGGQATPEIIYVTMGPASPSVTPELTPDGSGSADASASASTSEGIAPTVSSTTITQAAGDGRWTVSFEKPVVGGVPTGAAMSNSITTKVNAYISTWTSSGLPNVTPPDVASTMEGTYSVAYVSPTLLSIRFSVTTFISGGAHPTTQVGSINFDVSTGNVIQLSEIFTSTAAALPVLTARSHALLTSALGGDLFWPATVTMDQYAHAWVFTAGGLEVAWDQGDISPMASGPVSVVIPWPQLAAVIANPGPAAGFLAAP
jgi:hypothetical protein